MFNAKRILVPRDFSDSSDQAVDYALDIAGWKRAEVHVLFAEVLHGDSASGSQGQKEAPDRMRERLLSGIDVKKHQSIPVVTAVVRDIAVAPAITSYAEQHEIDLVVMGTHGRRGLSRILLGSTAEDVVRTAPCPVLLTRESRSESQADQELRDDSVTDWDDDPVSVV